MQGIEELKNFKDHWPLVNYVRLPQKKETRKHKSFSILKRWRPKIESDATGFGRMIVESFEDASDLMGDVSIEDITEELFKAVRVNMNHQQKEAEL